jgi:murein DD-endopeptidase MepM/ murein hydrolase activator NlpD
MAAVTLVLVAAAVLVWRSPARTSAGGGGAADGGHGLVAAQAQLLPASGAPAHGAPGPTQGGGATGGSTPPVIVGSTSPGPATPADRDHVAMVPARPAPPATLTGYVWPIAHPRLTLPFGPTDWGTRIVDGKLFHDGVDLATFCNDRIMAAHDGVVLAAGRHFDNEIGWVGSLDAYYRYIDAHGLWFDLPNAVIVDDGNGYRSIYAHMWKLTVKVGQHVRAGQLIGYEGMTGHATGCHVHYGLYSPLETATFGIEPKVAHDMRLPTLEIARIDPLLVLPYRKGLGGVVRSLGG